MSRSDPDGNPALCQLQAARRARHRFDAGIQDDLSCRTLEYAQLYAHHRQRDDEQYAQQNPAAHAGDECEMHCVGQIGGNYSLCR